MTSNQENQALPPKTCTIDRLITIPADIEKVLQGKKRATRRNGRYADIGETMTLEDHQFIIDKVYQQKLGELTDEDAIKEGYADLEAYKEAILSLHPGMPWIPKMQVWVHEFSPVSK
ncbi:ASCH domain-containing protein [Gracilibacillus oryzae]|uniref:ASCH domain-containing protein n=1 Tax=Gracilibacillus oryzae TaxID=1672701 RepID=A0A7C8GQB4_9BACI|nr:ASCH domain-containing protein [Gracilibacillus oryzae]KAB8125501.1 ASCH domain-containing protein [Gracilibacillus oryzae]